LKDDLPAETPLCEKPKDNQDESALNEAAMLEQVPGLPAS